MKLYGSYTSPFVRHCRITLAETGLDCEFIETLPANKGELPPTLKIPFLTDGDLQLHDSTSIIRYMREKANMPFLPDIESFDFFGVVNTALDSVVNIFQLERSGVTVSNYAYLQRQQERVLGTVSYINEQLSKRDMGWDDAMIRLVCFADWAIYRDRVDLSAFDQIHHWLNKARDMDSFASTAIPQDS